ncbi:peptidoglycan-binding protein ArfA [Mycolicibacterium chitae]|uniref:Outer membrane protein OmpA n=1 Tax=Mycolicibacterium chitae TaxID=1792 RepID=A0A3S5EI17_MYCCI|nr:OmpA family protein [Mycolicibacterium chitae]BBZ02838.1 peptidoglycan-binding protein ArfA [Mycolicibacterium chitae]VEG45786.1 outer membrane protein OmpA [Mycolicibacterium chitae]
MTDPDETRTITGWKTASRFYRQKPGLGWLLALLAVPLLLGLLGWGTLDKSGRDLDASIPSIDPTVSEPEVNLPGLPTALSIMRNGNDIMLSGDLPDAAARTGLLDLLRSIHGPDVNLVDNLNIAAGAPGPDLTGLQGVFSAAVDIPDFNWKREGDNVTLTGIAPNEEVRAAVEAAARSAWPEANITNRIQVATAPAPGGDCATLQSDITALIDAPINFETDGATLTSGSEQMLSRVAEKITACPEARISVDGYTDNSGNDAINIPLSANRAKSVAEFLISQGVAADLVTSRGHGSANPIAGNDTPAGKAQNRRVEITVS